MAYPSPALVEISSVRWNGHRRVVLIGEIDLSNVDGAESDLIDMVSNCDQITLDLVGLTYLDSQGIAMLVRLAERARLNGGTLKLANPRGIVRRVLDITNLDDLIPVTESAADAPTLA